MSGVDVFRSHLIRLDSLCAVQGMNQRERNAARAEFQTMPVRDRDEYLDACEGFPAVAAKLEARRAAGIYDGAEQVELFEVEESREPHISGGLPGVS